MIEHFSQTVRPSTYQWWPILRNIGHNGQCCRLLSEFFGRFGQNSAKREKVTRLKNFNFDTFDQKIRPFKKKYQLHVVNIRCLNDFMLVKIKKIELFVWSFQVCFAYTLLFGKHILAPNDHNLIIQWRIWCLSWHIKAKSWFWVSVQQLKLVKHSL